MHVNDFTDEALIGCLAAGDDRAFELLFIKYVHKLYLFACEHTHDREFAKELVMDVLLRVWQNRTKLAHVQSLQGYLYKSVRNALIDQYRKKMQELHSLEDVQHASGSSWQADHRLLDRELQQALQQGLQQLSPQRRLIFEMKRDQHLTNKEIADRLQLSPKTVENHMTAAIAFLKNYFGENTDLVLSLFGCWFITL